MEGLMRLALLEVLRALLLQAVRFVPLEFINLPLVRLVQMQVAV
jgi:hypothetical protein